MSELSIKSQETFPASERKVLDKTKPFYQLVLNYNKALGEAEEQVRQVYTQLYKPIIDLCEGADPVEAIKDLRTQLEAAKGETAAARKEVEKAQLEGTAAVNKAKEEAAAELENKENELHGIIRTQERTLNGITKQMNRLLKDNEELEERNKALIAAQDSFKKKAIADIKAKARHNNPISVLEIAVKVVEQTSFEV